MPTRTCAHSEGCNPPYPVSPFVIGSVCRAIPTERNEMSRESVDARLLGPLEVERDGVPVALGGPAQRALLARLLLDPNRTVAVDRLLEDLWGEDAPASAVKMVHIYVSMLRKLLPAGVLVTRSPGYVVAIEPEAVDLVRFERLGKEGRAALAGGSAAEAADRLREALALWRGPALAEFDEPFAAIESARLEELRLACVEDRIDADLSLGRHAGLVGELDALVARHPLRERPRGQLMLALYRSGRQADALAGYRRLRQLLSTELGIEPSRSLRELERRMLQQDPSLDLAAVEPTPRVPAAGLRPRPPTGLLNPHRGTVGPIGTRWAAAWTPRRRPCAAAVRGPMKHADPDHPGGGMLPTLAYDYDPAEPPPRASASNRARTRLESR
jgi:DNA-binding SARP family transcriptional activator